jgi:hypothetical protein
VARLFHMIIHCVPFRLTTEAELATRHLATPCMDHRLASHPPPRSLATRKLCRQGGRGIRSGPGPGGWHPSRSQLHEDRRWRGDFTCGGENGECRFLPLAHAALSLLIRLFVPGIGSRVCAALDALAEATGRLHCARASFQLSSWASR